MYDAYDAFIDHELQQVDQQILGPECLNCDDLGEDYGPGLVLLPQCRWCGAKPRQKLMLIKRAFNKHRAA